MCHATIEAATRHGKMDTDTATIIMLTERTSNAYDSLLPYYISSTVTLLTQATQTAKYV